MNRFLTSAIAVVAVVASSSAVLAQSPVGLQKSVSYADLNIVNPSGAAVLLQRLRVASRDVCGPAPAIGDLDRSAPYKACVSTALDNAVAAVGSPQLGAIYNGNSPTEQLAQN